MLSKFVRLKQNLRRQVWWIMEFMRHLHTVASRDARVSEKVAFAKLPEKGGEDNFERQIFLGLRAPLETIRLNENI